MSGIGGVWNLDARPFESPLRDRSALAFDGRLDNRDELLAGLAGRGVTSCASDCALILDVFREWGTECLRRLNGEFRLAIFDSARKQLILARDSVGCRPLYYWTNGRTFVFGSEIKTVLACPGVPSRPNRDLIADYFVRDRLPYEDCGETFFDGIYAVLPGHQVTASTAGVTAKTFCDFNPQAAVRLTSYADYAERLRELVFQAVKRRLRTGHPVAVAVSGGLDSSIVLCVADRLQKNGDVASPLLPISLTAPGREATEDTHALARLESTTGLRIERLPFGVPGDREGLDNAAWNSEWPRFDDGWCAQRPLFTWARAQGARTLLTGHWSDQFSFATGYLSDLFVRFKWGEIASHLNEYSRWFVDADPRYFQRRFRRELAFNVTSHRLRRWIRPLVREKRVAGREALMASDVAARIDRARPILPRPRCYSAHARDIYQAVHARSHRLQLEADAKLAASCGIEWTTPFLDRDLIAYLMAVPGEIQNRHGVPRALFRDAMRGIVPDDIVRRRWRNEDDFVRTRELEYMSRSWSFDAAIGLGLVRPPFVLRRDTLELVGLESWSRVFFSDRLTSLQHSRTDPSRPDGVCEAMDTHPTPKDDREKLPYSPPKLTVHGDLRTLTAAKQSDRSEAGQPKTFSSGMP